MNKSIDFDHCIERFEPKYPKAIACLAKDKDAMLAFYDYPAENWQHIRTSHPIESVFASVRLEQLKPSIAAAERPPWR